MLLQAINVPAHGTMDTQRRTSEIWIRKDFLENVIKNDIPHEELANLRHQEISNQDMDFHSPVSFEHFDSPTSADPSEFHSVEYLEYRRRVFEELATEYDKYGNSEKKPAQSTELITELPGDYHISDDHYPISPTEGYSYSNSLHSNIDMHGNNKESSEDNNSDLSPSQQPDWDDSDLKTEPVVTSPLLSKTGENNLINFRTNLLSGEGYESDEKSLNIMNEDTENIIPSMHWTELERQLEIMTKQHKDQINLKQEVSPQPRRTFSPPTRRRSSKSSLQKQKNDREAILQKLSKGDPEVDSLPFGSDKPWYQPRLERSFSGNNQNLQICYINNSCSSSDNEEDKNDSKNSPSKYTSSGEMPSPALSSPGFGMRRNLPPYRMSSSSSTVSLSSTSSAGHHMSSSSLPSEGEIINIRSSPHTDEISKAITMQERLELDARKAITQAHQEARRLAEQERNKRKGSTTSLERLMRVPLDENTRQKVKTRTLTNDDCSNMTVGQLQVILNNMHADKEGMNSELMVILETRDELRTEQDAKLIDVDDMKAMLSATGPETTV